MSTKESVQMLPKLEATVARLIVRLGPVFKTQAVKLPYLVDVVAMRALGRPITEAHHATWDHGVVTTEAYQAVDKSPVFIKDRSKVSEATPRVGLSPDARLSYKLSSTEEEIIDFVADLFGRLPPRNLGKLTKRMNPEINEEEWGKNKPAKVDFEAYVHMGNGWQRLLEKLETSNVDDSSKWAKVTNTSQFVRATFRA